GDGLVGHDAVDAQVEQPFHGRAIVDGPGVDLQAQRLGPADERLRGHRRGHLDTADPGARQPVGQRPLLTRPGRLARPLLARWAGPPGTPPRPAAPFLAPAAPGP